MKIKRILLSTLAIASIGAGLISCNNELTEVIIKNIELTSETESTKTFTISYSDGTSKTFDIKNGTNGSNGTNGTDGVTPHIGENGNWFIGEVDTGINAQGNDYDAIGLAYYPLDDGNYAVGVGKASQLSNISIPNKYRGKNVTKIISEGFKGAKIQSLIIPTSVVEIGNNAFEDCERLNKVIYGENAINVVTFNEFTTKVEGLTIGDNAFLNTNFPRVEIKDAEKGSLADVYVTNPGTSIDKINYSFALNDSTDKIATGTILAPHGANKLHSQIDMGAYGNFKKDSLDFISGTNSVAKVEGSKLGITAKEYNFAELSATYPVLVFSLKAKEITQSGTIPTYVTLDRNAAYDWDKLSNNMESMPFVSKEYGRSSVFHAIRPQLSAYIKELYELDRESKFNLFLGDNYCELILEMFVANQIPDSNWTATMLSDGTGTAGILEQTFAVDNPSEKFNKMVESWNKIKNHTFMTGKYDPAYIKANLYEVADYQYYFQMLERYPYVITKSQDNVNWWVNRLRTGENLSKITAKDSAFASDIVSTAQSFYTNSLLSALSDEEKVAFKNMYHFSDEMFSEARANNKKIMIVLGTSWSGEKESFYDYLKMTMEYYGDDYVYYYKGHPGYGTINFPDRKVALDKLNSEGYTIVELDNSIAAEVILFYNPDVYLCGWQSSTFDSVESQEMACALYDKNISSESSLTYGVLVDMYISKIKTGSAYLENSSLELDSSKTYYVMEFNDTVFPGDDGTLGTADDITVQKDNYDKHEIAIYCAEDGTIKYYKLQSGTTYVEVSKDGTTVTSI